MHRALVIIFILCYPFLGNSQNILLEGSIKNQAGESILGVNMLAKPLEEGNKTVFAFTDFNGLYKVQLRKEVSYALSITYVGYATIIDTIQFSTNTTKHYSLEQDLGQLDEVVIKAKMAILVKEDTLTYRPDTFVTGNERKLREILEKLPGLEVDREGNVTVYGKKVTDLLVDGKPFFGGNTQLGVNNIPADVVEELEVIDDYHEVSFMKGLQASERMAMNIKLKEGKKDFVFGNIEASGGKDEKYNLNPSVFYYSPKTTVNFIGSLNNINKSPMGRGDVNRFRGETSTYSSSSPLSNQASSLSQYATSEDVIQKNTAFAAANFTHRINNKLSLDAYTLINYQRSDALSTGEIQYLLNENLLETRENSRNTKNLSSLSNIKLGYRPKLNSDMAYNVLVDYGDTKSTQKISSQYDANDKLMHLLQTPDKLEISQTFRWNLQPSFKQTYEINASHSYQRGSNPMDWLFNEPVFSSIIPSIEDGDTYNFLQNRSSDTHKASAEIKYFWVLNSSNHLYPFAGLHFFDQTYKTTDYQLLQDGTENSFDSADFNNDIAFSVFNPYIGFQYKIMIGKAFFRPGLVYNYYAWKANQFDLSITDKSKAVLLPELNIEYSINNNISLDFDYELKSSFKDASEYANRYKLQSFNQLYKGNENLENELYHQASLSIRSISMLNNMHGFLNLMYSKRERSIRQTTIIEGIDQISTSMYSNLPEKNYMLMASLSRTWWRSFVLSGTINASLSDYSRWINSEKIDYKNNAIGYSLQSSYRKKNFPYIRVVWKQRFSNSKSNTYKSEYIVSEPSFYLEYNFLKNFVVKGDYEYSFTKQRTTNQKETFQLANASLEYRKPNSKFAFEIRVDNIFDLKHKRYYATDQYMIYDQYVYIHPRTAMFVVNYKL